MSLKQRFSDTLGQFVQRKVGARTVRAMQVFKWTAFLERLEHQVAKTHGVVRLVYCSEAVSGGHLSVTVREVAIACD